MKQLFFVCMIVMTSLVSQAQTDSLADYTGKYKFPDGSPVTEIGVVIENGILTATSVMGNTELRKTDNKDVFEIVAFGGTATFKRADDGKVKMLRVQVQDVDMEGTRQEAAVFLQFHDEFSGDNRCQLFRQLY
ncbi:MAG: hypothetical protein IPP99_10475 [Chitinophagaceae bacterium]|nr:hypothetical protein [Chitinophagaceae bacterium]